MVMSMVICVRQLEYGDFQFQPSELEDMIAGRLCVKGFLNILKTASSAQHLNPARTVSLTPEIHGTISYYIILLYHLRYIYNKIFDEYIIMKMHHDKIIIYNENKIFC